MNDNRRQILEMLATGKITADEAERLLVALDPETTPAAGKPTSSAANGQQPSAPPHARQISARTGRGR